MKIHPGGSRIVKDINKEIALEPILKRRELEQTAPLERNAVEQAFQEVLKKVNTNLDTFTHRFPAAASENNIYPATDNVDWTTGFWTGILWLAYEVSGDSRYRNAAELQVTSFKERAEKRIDTDHHDMGFLYSLSCVAAHKLTGSEEGKQAALEAAELLMLRYKEKGGFIQAWGSLDDPKNYRLIIDCLMNLPLLYWSSQITEDPKYRQVAVEHFRSAVSTVIREDASTYHTYYFDPITGEPNHGVTHQGYSDDSCWARGQAWGIYGLPLTYIYEKDTIVPEAFKRLANYFLNRLPEDWIPYWDLIFTSRDEPRDSSAASIAVCGLLEMCKWLDPKDPDRELYRNAAFRMLQSLMERYTTKDMPDSNGLLLHAVYSKPHNLGVDECNLWGDYFYVEALVRCLKEWELYW
jgi:unsaturated chondroitin disaccharide hydrolase